MPPKKDNQSQVIATNTPASPSRAMDTESNPRVSATLQDLITMVSQSIQPKKIKAPRYSKSQDLLEYLQNFERIATINEWRDEEAGVELQNALEGEALTHALSAQSTSFHEIARLLKDRLILRPEEARLQASQLKATTEDMDELAANCRRLIDRGYGRSGLNLHEDDMEAEKIRTFIRAIKKTDMAVYVKGQRPATLHDAVYMAKEFQRVVKDHNPPKVRNLEVDKEPMEELLSQIAEIKLHLGLPTADGEEVQCFKCGGNHYARGCPNKKSKHPLN
jgi:hypothetical protein